MIAYDVEVQGDLALQLQVDVDVHEPHPALAYHLLLGGNMTGPQTDEVVRTEDMHRLVLHMTAGYLELEKSAHALMAVGVSEDSATLRAAAHAELQQARAEREAVNAIIEMQLVRDAFVAFRRRHGLSVGSTLRAMHEAHAELMGAD